MCVLISTVLGQLVGVLVNYFATVFYDYRHGAYLYIYWLHIYWDCHWACELNLLGPY